MSKLINQLINSNPNYEVNLYLINYALVILRYEYTIIGIFVVANFIIYTSGVHNIIILLYRYLMYVCV